MWMWVCTSSAVRASAVTEPPGCRMLPSVPTARWPCFADYQALGTLEWHSAKWDIYTNAGGEYAARTAYLNSAGKGVGYGSPLFSNAGCSTETLPGSNGFTPGGLTSCTGDTRNIIQGTLGFWYRFYKGPRARCSGGRSTPTWFAIPGPVQAVNPHGIENMFFTSFRYYLP